MKTPRLDSTRAFADPRGSRAFTLVEVVMAIALFGLLFSGIIVAYTQAARRAEWTGRSLAAQALAIQEIEQARSARWDLRTGLNEVTNLNLLSRQDQGSKMTGYTWKPLDVPTSGTDFVPATNYVTVTLVTGVWNNLTKPTVTLRMVRVDTVWPFRWGKTTRLYTNTVCTYCAPDN